MPICSLLYVFIFYGPKSCKQSNFILLHLKDRVAKFEARLHFNLCGD